MPSSIATKVRTDGCRGSCQTAKLACHPILSTVFSLIYNDLARTSVDGVC